MRATAEENCCSVRDKVWVDDGIDDNTEDGARQMRGMVGVATLGERVLGGGLETHTHCGCAVRLAVVWLALVVECAPRATGTDMGRGTVPRAIGQARPAVRIGT